MYKSTFKGTSGIIFEPKSKSNISKEEISKFRKEALDEKKKNDDSFEEIGTFLSIFLKRQMKNF